MRARTRLVDAFPWIVVGFLLFGRVGHAAPADPPSQLAEDNNQTDPPKKDKEDGDPVVLSTGAFSIEKTDLVIRGRGMDFELRRTYRSGSSVSSALGVNWDFNWNQKIVLEQELLPTGGGGAQAQASAGEEPPGGGGPPQLPPLRGIYYFNGELRVDPFNPADFSSPDGYFAKLSSTGTPYPYGLPDALVLRTADGRILTFGVIGVRDPEVKGIVYYLTRLEDRHGNAFTLEYEDARVGGPGSKKYKRLEKVYDTYGRAIVFDYDSSSNWYPPRLIGVQDIYGRRIEFEQDAQRNLISVTGPDVSGTEFDEGKKVVYEYGTAQGPDEHNLLKVYDAQEVQSFPTPVTPYLTTTYLGGGRVAKQLNGGTNPDVGGYYVYYYELQQPGLPIDWTWFQEASRTLVIDPNGNVELTLFDASGFDRLTYRFTGRLNPENRVGGVVTTGSLADLLTGFDPAEWEFPESVQSDTSLQSPDEAPLRASDPGSFVTRKDYDAEGLLTEIWEPGRHAKFTYDTSSDRFQRGNLLVKETWPVPVAGRDPIVELFAYEPIYNQLRASVDPRGTWNPFYPPHSNGMNEAAPEDYESTTIYDYQEASFQAQELSQLVGTWGIETVQQTQQDKLAQYQWTVGQVAMGMGDLNGDGIQFAGNPIVVHAPPVHVASDPTQASPSYVSQSIETVFAYNAFSLVTSRIDPEGNTTQFLYNPEASPTGDCLTPGTSSGGGFLERTIEPEGVEQMLCYDAEGRIVKRTDGRGFATN